MNQERILMRSPSVSAELQRADYQKRKERLLLLEQTGNLAAGQKRCFKCKETKPLNEFYSHPQMADGRLGKCKECTKKDVATRYTDPIGRQKVRSSQAAWRQFKSTKRRQFEYQRIDRKRNPAEYKARYIVSNAIRDRRLVRLPCEMCGDPKSQGHHEDYSKPLNVRWLCFKHHREIAHGQKVG